MNVPNSAAAVGRIALSLIFVLSGIGKLAALQATQGYIQSVGVPLPELALWGAIVVEVGGGLALLSGFRTRAIALVLAVFTVLTAVLFHANFADQNQMIHFLKNIAIMGGLLQLAAYGAPAFSVDALTKRSSLTLLTL